MSHPNTVSRRARTTLSRRARLGAAALVVALAASVSACGAETAKDAAPAAAPAATSAESLVVEDPWVRSTEGTNDTTMTAAFMVLDNTGDDEITITGASSEVTPMVQLHEMAMVKGKSVMREIDGGITLAPGKGQLLQPGGMHVMFMNLKQPLKAGEEVALTLELADGSTKEITAPVKVFTEEAEHYHAPGTPAHED